MSAILIFWIDEKWEISSLKTITKPRKEFDEYKVGENVSARFAGKTYDAIIFAIDDKLSLQKMASRQQFESDLKNFIATHKTPTVPKKSPEKEKTTSEKQSIDDGKRKFSKNNELTSSEQHALEVLKKRRPITNVSESASQPAPYLETTRTDETVMTSASINYKIAAATQHQASPNFQTTPPNFQTTPPNFQTTTPNFQTTTSPNFQTTTPPNFQTTSPNFQTTTSPNFQTTTSPNFQTTTSPNFQTTSPNFQTTTSPNFQTTSTNFITTSPNLQTTSNNFITTSQKENYYDIPSNYQTSTYIDLDYQQSTSMASSLSNAMGTLYGAPEVEPSPVNQEMSCHECCRKIMHIESQLKSFQAKLEQLEQLQKDSRKPFTATPILNKIQIHENRLPLTPTESNSPSLSPSVAQLHQQVINLIGVETRPVKAIMRVMRGMFSINELSTCSMKGQPTTKFESSRPGLPDDKRNAIIDVLARKFNLSNVVTEGKVRSALRRFRDMYS